uniref:Uncharacterized protein n=1 Tax=Ralstonia syzygii R24 TaxID=907261 RepID=G3A634_9RALS|nr:hypothetical protein RALSY_40109 [Ralstonia syzygii R24]
MNRAKTPEQRWKVEASLTKGKYPG